MAKTPKIIVQKANAFQLNPNKTYIIHAPGFNEDETAALHAWLKEHGINNAVVVMADDLQITEADPNVA